MVPLAAYALSSACPDRRRHHRVRQEATVVSWRFEPEPYVVLAFNSMCTAHPTLLRLARAAADHSLDEQIFFLDEERLKRRALGPEKLPGETGSASSCERASDAPSLEEEEAFATPPTPATEPGPSPFKRHRDEVILSSVAMVCHASFCAASDLKKQRRAESFHVAQSG